MHKIFVVFLKWKRGFLPKKRHSDVLFTTLPHTMLRDRATGITMCTTLNIPSNGASILNFSLHTTSVLCLSYLWFLTVFALFVVCILYNHTHTQHTVCTVCSSVYIMPLLCSKRGVTGLQKLTLCYTLSYYKNVGWKDTQLLLLQKEDFSRIFCILENCSRLSWNVRKGQPFL